MRVMVGRRAEDHLASADDGPHDRRRLEVELASRVQRDLLGCCDTDLMTFRDFVRGHETIEQRVGGLAIRSSDITVSGPRDTHVCRVADDGNAERDGQPSCACADPAVHHLRRCKSPADSEEELIASSGRIRLGHSLRTRTYPRGGRKNSRLLSWLDPATVNRRMPDGRVTDGSAGPAYAPAWCDGATPLLATVRRIKSS